MSASAGRHQLLLSTAALLGALASYGRSASAQIVSGGLCSVIGGAGSGVVQCTGVTATDAQSVTHTSDLAVTVEPTPLQVDTGAGNALTITGQGNVSFVDNYVASLLDSSGAIGSTGLSIRSTGGAGDVTVETSGTVTGDEFGIDARNLGAGTLSITANGTVTNTGSDGGDAAVNAVNGSFLGTTLTVTTGAGSRIIGGQYSGIRTENFGIGEQHIRVDGYVNGNFFGITARQLNGDSDLIITTGADSDVIGRGRDAIRAVSENTGNVRITVNGEVSALDDTAIFADQQNGGDIIITSNTGSTISAGVGADGLAVETTGGRTNLIVAGTLLGGRYGAVEFDQATPFENRLELHPGFVITNNASAGARDTVLAGPGQDTLAFGGVGESEFDLGNVGVGQQFQAFETLEVAGGTWNLSGTTGLPLTVEGGTLRGTGTFGGLTVNAGTLAPGNSIGTMIVNGAFTLGGGAIYEVEVNSAGNNDKVIVNGTVNLTGATLRVLAEDGNYDPRTDYTIIENDGTESVVGTFGSVSTNLAFLTPEVNYAAGDGNDVVLTLLRNLTLFPDVAQTKNQKAVAGALSQFPTDNPLFLSVLTQSAEGARQAFDALSGEVHATVAGTLVDDSRYAREAVLDRMMQASHRGGALGAGGPQSTDLAVRNDTQPMMLSGSGAYDGKSLVDVPQSSPLAFWTQGYGAWGTFDGDGNAATADRNLGGFISGMDADVWNGWRVGIATGASFSDLSVDQRYSGANTQTYHLGGYVNGDVGGFALRGGGLWAWSDIETSRAVVFPGFFERQEADYDADTGQLFGEIAYPTQIGSIDLEPFAGLAFVSVESGGFRERGGPETSLRTGGFDQDVGYTSVGLRAATTIMWGAMAVTPHVEAAWLHALDDVTPGASLAFATTGIGFAIDGVPLAEDSTILDAGLDFAISERLTAGVSFTGQYADNVSDNGVRGHFTWLF